MKRRSDLVTVFNSKNLYDGSAKNKKIHKKPSRFTLKGLYCKGGSSN